MMITEKQLKIFEVFARKPFAEFTRKQVKKELREKSKNAVKKLKEEIDAITQFYSIVVFGSYAVNEQKPSSDMDVAIFIDGREKRKHIEAAINSAKLKMLAEVDAQVIPKAEMIEMLTNDEENLGKQIARKHLAVHNHQIFYNIIKEGMKRGFRA